MLITTVFDTGAALYDATRKRLETIAEKAADTPTAALLPGGNTPKPLFADIAATPFPLGSAFHIGYTDERHVSEDNPANNHGQAIPMLDALGVAPERVLRVHTELPLEEAALKYHESWRSFFDQGGMLALALLGLGADGHTCSLFSEAQIADCPSDRYAVAVNHEADFNRVTVTPALLARARHVIILATGREKAAVVDAMLQPNSRTPAALAVADCARVSLWYAHEA